MRADTKDGATVEIITPDGGTSGPMPMGEFKERIATALDGMKHSDEFALEPSDGNIPADVIEELRHARAVAKDYAQSYSDAVTAQATKYKLKPGALKRYVNALEADKLEDLDAETNDLEKLIG